MRSDVHLAVSYANHDCEPNTSYSNDYHMIMRTPNQVVMVPKAEVSFTALTDIQEGEEITINYVGIEMDCRQRELNLIATYGIHCTCSKCDKERKKMEARQAKKTKKSSGKVGVK